MYMCHIVDATCVRCFSADFFTVTNATREKIVIFQLVPRNVCNTLKYKKTEQPETINFLDNLAAYRH